MITPIANAAPANAQLQGPRPVEQEQDDGVRTFTPEALTSPDERRDTQPQDERQSGIRAAAERESGGEGGRGGQVNLLV